MNMTTPIEEAIILLAIGMITVFVILGLVVLSGNLLIRAVNHFAPEKIRENLSKEPYFKNKEIAIISAVIDRITMGKGRVEHIERIKE